MAPEKKGTGKNGTGKKGTRKKWHRKKWHKVHDRKKWHNFISYDVTNVLMLLNRLNRLHYGFEKFIYFCFQQKKIACIIEIIEKKIVPFFPIMHFVPFFPVPFFPCAFFSCAIFSCAFFSGAILSYTHFCQSPSIYMYNSYSKCNTTHK